MSIWDQFGFFSIKIILTKKLQKTVKQIIENSTEPMGTEHFAKKKTTNLSFKTILLNIEKFIG